MEKLFKEMIERASKDKKSLLLLKDVCVRLQQYELAKEIRDLEKKNFPESKEVIEAKRLGDSLNVVLRMIEFDIAPKNCWLLYETIALYQRKKGDFSIEDAAELIAKRDSIF